MRRKRGGGIKRGQLEGEGGERLEGGVSCAALVAWVISSRNLSGRNFSTLVATLLFSTSPPPQHTLPRPLVFLTWPVLLQPAH